MKAEQIVYSKLTGWIVKNDNDLKEKAQLVLVFGSRELLKEKEQFEYLKLYYPLASIVGCSTSGEIAGEEVFNESIIATAVYFEKTSIEIVSEEIISMNDSFRIGERLAGKLLKDKLIHVFVLSEGLNINGSELSKGLNSKLDNKVSVTGGLAGDQALFKETVVVNNTPGEKNRIVAIGFYGDNISIAYGSMGGWDSFGVDREITRSIGNVLYELDNKPALDLYKSYLGEHASGLPASALLFPLSLKIKGSETSLVRTVLSVDEKVGSMTFAGDLPQGEYARLMMANMDRLIEGASGAAEMTITGLKDSNPDFAILISCVGRKLVLKQRTEEELEIVREILGDKVLMTGFYSYGELCPDKPFNNQCELHNQTMTITAFKEF